MYLDRNFVLGHFNLGVIYKRMGRARDARRAWTTTHDLLQRMAPEEELPHSDGLTAGELAFTLGVYVANVV